jgi:hypothetical protein
MSIIKAPLCVVAGCGKSASYKKKNANGSLLFRNYCSKHHKMRTDIKVSKKSYCENNDGHLGFGPCGEKIVDSCQLHIDHVDGDRYNDNSQNLRTYCANCHALKTKRCEDHSNRYHSTVETTFEKLFSF